LIYQNQSAVLGKILKQDDGEIMKKKQTDVEFGSSVRRPHRCNRRRHRRCIWLWHRRDCRRRTWTCAATRRPQLKTTKRTVGPIQGGSKN